MPAIQNKSDRVYVWATDGNLTRPEPLVEVVGQRLSSGRLGRPRERHYQQRRVYGTVTRIEES